MKFLRLVSDYRWPIYIGGHLAMSVVACGVLVWVATRPDAPRPIQGYYEAAQAWDADEAVEDASRQLGWTVRYELPSDVPHFAACRGRSTSAWPIATARPVSGLDRPPVRHPAVRHAAQPDAASSSSCRSTPGSYRTLVRLDEPARGNCASTPRSRRCGSSTRRALTSPPIRRPRGGAAVTAPRATRAAGAAAGARARTAASPCPPASCATDDAEQFCCNGCRQVYTLVREWGFDQYYRLVDRQQAHARARARQRPQLRRLRRRAAAGGGDRGGRPRPPPHAALPRRRALRRVRVAGREAAGGAARRGRGAAELRQRRRRGHLAARRTRACRPSRRALDRLGYTPHVHRASRVPGSAPRRGSRRCWPASAWPPPAP